MDAKESTTRLKPGTVIEAGELLAGDRFELVNDDFEPAPGMGKVREVREIERSRSGRHVSIVTTSMGWTYTLQANMQVRIVG